MDYENDPFANCAWVPFDDIVEALRELGVRDMSRYFYCVYLEKGALTTDMRDLLMRTAVAMACMKKSSMDLKTDWCEGRLSTRFSFASMDTISGIKFECELDVEDKTTKASFIVTTKLLDQFKDAAWLNEGDDSFGASYFN